MLDKLRESAHGVFAKILLGLLVISFGIWGIGDVFRNGGGVSSIATIGKYNISEREYSAALRHKQNELLQKLGKNFNTDLLNKLGIGQIVLKDLIDTKLLANEIDALGLNVSDDEIGKAIINNPNFFDKDGKFDKNIYLTILRDNGLKEATYEEELRKDIATRLLIDTITSGVVVPENLAATLYKAEQEQRVADILVISPSAIKQIPAPSEQEVKAYYDAHNKFYLTPEYRTVSFVELKLADIANKIQVSDEEIKQSYEDRIAEFHRPEKRIAEQMIFTKEEDAKKALESLKKASFAEIAKSANIVNKGKTSLGAISKQELPADAAEELFALPENSVSKIVKSDFGWHIFVMGKKTPETTAPLAEVRGDLSKEIALKKAQETVAHLSNEFEDALAGGASFAVASEKIGQKITTLPKIGSDGKAIDGKKVAIPNYDKFLEVAFATAEKEHSAAISNNDGSYLILQVDNINASSVRPLAEVKDKIISELKEEKKQELLKKLAETASKNFGKDITDKVIVSSGKIKRDSSAIEKHALPKALVLDIFRSQIGANTKSYQAQNSDYMIASVKEVIPATAQPEKTVLDRIHTELRKNLANEVYENYINYLRGKYSVTINKVVQSSEDSEQ